MKLKSDNADVVAEVCPELKRLIELEMEGSVG